MSINNDSFNTNLPFDLMYQASRKEASRKKPVFFIHKYFARRITANFRMSLFGFISNKDEDIMEQFYKKSPMRDDITVLDPFMGGGTAIFEALRFGCRVIGNDLQPLSYFVTKALVESVDEEAVIKEVNKLEKAVGETIKSYYKTTCPCCGKAADGMYAFHVKKAYDSVTGEVHRFFTSFIIAYKKNEFTVVCPQCGKLTKTKFEKGKFVCDCGWTLSSLKDSYVSNGVYHGATNKDSRSLTDYDTESGYPFATDIIAIEYCCPHCGAHDYKAPEEKDIALYSKAKEDFLRIEKTLPIPDQDIPQGYNTNQMLNHGYRKFRDLFNERQLLCLGLLLQEINKTDSKDIQFWLQLAFSGMLEMNNMFCRYQQNAYKICNIFFNHAYVPIAMPVENCVWGAKLGTGTFEKTIKKVLRGKRYNQNIYDLSAEKTESGKYNSVKKKSEDIVEVKCVESYADLDGKHPLLKCSDSRDLHFIPDNSVDLVLTDPPYGANVMYSELIDFFHVWNHYSSIASIIGFEDPLSPKQEEIIVNPTAGKDVGYYHDGITAVFKTCHSKLKDNGYLVFSFHDKCLDSWLAVLDSIFDSGFSLLDCCPVQAETRTGAHTSNKNSIGIDILLISKKTTIESEQIKLVDKNLIDKALQATKEFVISTLERLQSVEAEITVPDIQNIAIAKFFVEESDYSNLDLASKQLVVTRLQSFLNNVEDIASDYTITKKRNGWWSELYRQKWNN